MIKKIKKEAFKSTYNLSPSETAAVVARWTRDERYICSNGNLCR